MIWVCNVKVRMTDDAFDEQSVWNSLQWLSVVIRLVGVVDFRIRTSKLNSRGARMLNCRKMSVLLSLLSEKIQVTDE